MTFREVSGEEKDKILAAYESGEINPKRQKMKRAENEDLYKAVYKLGSTTLVQTMFQFLVLF